MCIPVLGAAIGAVGSLATANAQSAGLKAQQKLQQRQAELERDKGAFDVQRAGDRSARLTGNQIASFGASGVELGGSPGLVIQDSLRESNLDIGAIKFGSQVRQDNLNVASQVSGINARQTKTAGVLGAISPFINAASQNQTFLSGAFS